MSEQEENKKDEDIFTYEQLRKVQRSERMSNDLERLDQLFYNVVSRYIKARISAIEDSRSKKDVFSLGNAGKIEAELQNIRKIMHEIYELRERKIIRDAALSIISGDKFHDTTRMLSFEEKMYYDTVELLKNYRNNILHPILTGDTIKIEMNTNETDLPDEDAKESGETNQNNNKIVRIIAPLQEFAWKEGKTYGPFKTEDVISLPRHLAEMLIKYKKAEEI
ncbi:MAG: hypothetical protein PHW96_02350 [Candidatus Nanoarchaeia archaeon]|nr:hypothetical protein [Candidatus Nanoarchaeia archaeon]